MTGRPKDKIWSHFQNIPGGKSRRVKCINCNKELSGLVKRMKKHLDTCENRSDREENNNVEIFDSDDECNIDEVENAGKYKTFSRYLNYELFFRNY